jgi:hypothetical protein
MRADLGGNKGVVCRQGQWLEVERSVRSGGSGQLHELAGPVAEGVVHLLSWNELFTSPLRSNALAAIH